MSQRLKQTKKKDTFLPKHIKKAGKQKPPRPRLEDIWRPTVDKKDPNDLEEEGVAVAQDDEMDDEVVAVRVGNGHSQLVQSSGDHDLKPYLPPQHTRAQRSPSGSDGTVDSGSSVKGDGRLDDDEHIGSPAGSDDTEDSAVALKDNGNLGRNEKFEPPSGIEGVNVLGADAGIDAGIDVEKKPEPEVEQQKPRRLGYRRGGLLPQYTDEYIDSLYTRSEIPPETELQKRTPYGRIPRMPADNIDGKYDRYWDENSSLFLRFIMDNYLVRKQKWVPLFRSRFEFLKNEKKIKKICDDIGCTREEYIFHFELDRSTRNQDFHANYAPMWVIATAATECVLTDFYVRVWKATYGVQPWDDTCAMDYLVKLHPPRCIDIIGAERLKDVTFYEKDPSQSTDVTWAEYLQMTWDTIEKCEREDEARQIDLDSDFDD